MVSIMLCAREAESRRLMSPSVGGAARAGTLATASASSRAARRSRDGRAGAVRGMRASCGTWDGQHTRSQGEGGVFGT
ncbi:hypothetical protein G6F53_014074 [Rhizopus delemar]|nr:hypothetical protein G6F53_014074 [Rhizopus delemar]